MACPSDYMVMKECLGLLSGFFYRMADVALPWVVRDIQIVEVKMARLLLNGSESATYKLQKMAEERDTLVRNAKKLRTLGV